MDGQRIKGRGENVATWIKRFRRLLGRRSRGLPDCLRKGGWPALGDLPDVDVLIDVGIGHQGTPGLYHFFSQSRKLFIDPLTECRLAVEAHLADGTNKFIATALGSVNGYVDINVQEIMSRSSILAIAGKVEQKNEEVRRVPLKRLDDLSEVQAIPRNASIGMKIDTEGYELEVLRGAPDTLKRSSFVILEVPIGRSRFKGSFSFEEAIFFMHEAGFAVASIRVSGTSGAGHGDVAFARRDLLFDGRKPQS